MQVEGVKVHVKEMVYCARHSWGGDIHAECVPPIPARQLHVEDTVKHQLPPSLTLLVEQWRAKTLARSRAMSWSCKMCCPQHWLSGTRAYSRIIKGKLDELGVCDGPCLDIPRHEA